MGTVTVHETRYTDDEITVYDQDGDPIESVDPPYDDDHTRTTTHENVRASEAAKIINDLGLTFGASGGSWASNPDGSWFDWRNQEHVEESAHLSGFPESGFSHDQLTG